MYFFNNGDGVSSAQNRVFSGGAVNKPLSFWQALLAMLLREKRSSYLFDEIVVAVLLLHVWILLWISAPTDPITLPKALSTMEVSLVDAPNQQPQAAPPAPPKPPEPPKPKPKPKPKLKPVVKKKTLVNKPLPKETMALPKPKESEADSSDAPPSPPAPPAPPAPPKKSAAPPAETFTEATFGANYDSKNKPEYPRMARNRGWEGKVLLKVHVSAEGRSDDVAIHRSSGHDILDESAIAAVKKWTFIPAMRGSTPVASVVIVPIIFTLN